MSRSQLATLQTPIEAKTYRHFKLEPLTGTFGA